MGGGGGESATAGDRRNIKSYISYCIVYIFINDIHTIHLVHTEPNIESKSEKMWRIILQKDVSYRSQCVYW